ncbi:TonB-dependent receptor domain-containing protein [Parvularcula oceani]|uniref:TonB-dependent receptor domain-containing protein n=1 Tax=Parvularcula oceani TaxID=1247963 RepID=UPI000560DBD7|nr:TonB-dependent receptor [Parvularcula oceani]
MTRNSSLAPSALLAMAMLSIATGARAQDAEAAAQTDTDEGDVIVVRGAFIPDEKRATSEIASVLDEEAFARAGDSDIAGALRRVTGVTITDGKFPVVRGLNERYSSTTLNGVPLPSPEPLRRAAPLDLFPTSILEGTLVQKTYSPQFSGEFGGGLIELRARAVPDDDFLTVGIGFEVDTETTLREGLFYEGSDTDVLGFDDGLRDLPEAAEQAVISGDTRLDPSVAVSFEQDDTLLLARDETPASGGGSLAFGKLFRDDADARIGTVFYFGYDNNWQTRDGLRERPERFSGSSFIDTPDAQVDFEFFETRQNILFNAYNTTGIEFAGGDHTIALTSYLLRDTLKRAQISTGSDFDVEGGDQQIRERTDFIERQVWQTQLNGDHLFAGLNDAELGWRVAYGEAERDAPYERQTTYIQDGEDGPFEFFEGTNDASFINFSTLQDENFYAAGDFTLPLTVANRAFELSAGASYSDRSRDNARRDFSFDGSIPDELARARADIVFSDPVLASGLLTLRPQASPLFPDESSASLEVLSVYGMADVELGDYVRASFGVRYEDSSEESNIDFRGDEVVADPVALDDEFFLPAATITWNPVSNIQVRAGYSRTITRPQFRELAGTEFVDPDNDVTFFGNPFLVNTEIDNFDARAEYYFGRGEFATLGVFYKNIEKPIEQFATGLDATTASFLNAPSAELYGVEAEFEKRFAFEEIGLGRFAQDKDLFFSTNYTWSDSEVSSDGEVTIPLIGLDAEGRTLGRTVDASGRITDGRRLQGQSEHLFNLQLGVEDVETQSKATLLLNYASDRILIVESPTSSGIRPAIVEEPPLSLDFVISQNLELAGGEYGFGLKVTNILGEDYSATQTDDRGVEKAFQEYDRGRMLSVSLKREF